MIKPVATHRMAFRLSAAGKAIAKMDDKFDSPTFGRAVRFVEFGDTLDTTLAIEAVTPYGELPTLADGHLFFKYYEPNLPHYGGDPPFGKTVAFIEKGGARVVVIRTNGAGRHLFEPPAVGYIYQPFTRFAVLVL